MKWCTIDKKFLDYLRSYESKIPIMNYGDNKFKPFFGVLFEVGELIYVTQISHAKERHIHIKENLDFIKLYDDKRLLAVVNLNYMFPILKNKLIEVKYGNIDEFRTFKDENEKNYYISLLKKELKEIKNREVDKRALDLYKLKYTYPNNGISKRCFEFKLLEQKCNEYINFDIDSKGIEVEDKSKIKEPIIQE